MSEKEIYFRIKRMLIVILVLMTIFSFSRVVTVSLKLEDNIQATNVLIEYIAREQK